MSDFEIEPSAGELFPADGVPSGETGWYLVPGKVDKISYLLLVFFAATVLFLFLFERMI